MAIKIKGSNNYIKLDLNSCVVDINGVHVGYFEYPNKDVREKEKLQQKQFSAIMNNISEYVSKFETKLLTKFGDKLPFNTQEEFLEALSEEEKKEYETVKNLLDDKQNICQGVLLHDSTFDEKLKNKQLLKKFGYSSDMFKDYSGAHCSVYSGTYSQQKFNYKDMYKELKKTFKNNGYEDC